MKINLVHSHTISEHSENLLASVDAIELSIIPTSLNYAGSMPHDPLSYSSLASAEVGPFDVLHNSAG